MEILIIKPMWPEDERFFLERKKVGNEYIFIHTITELSVMLNGNFATMPPGSVICFAPSSYQCIKASGGSLVHDWMHLSPDFGEIAKEYSFETGKIYTLSDDSFVTKLMQEAELEKLNGGLFSEKICELKVREIIAKIMRSETQGKKDKEVSPAVRAAFSTARSKIHLEYSKPWNIESMAELVHLSPSRFFSIYKTIFGISPKNDLLNIRMEHAKMLLLGGNIPVKDVAEMTGYTNVYHFIRAFKLYTGKTPGKYCKTEFVKDKDTKSKTDTPNLA